MNKIRFVTRYGGADRQNMGTLAVGLAVWFGQAVFFWSLTPPSTPSTVFSSLALDLSMIVTKCNESVWSDCDSSNTNFVRTVSIIRIHVRTCCSSTFLFIIFDLFLWHSPEEYNGNDVIGEQLRDIYLPLLQILFCRSVRINTPYFVLRTLPSPRVSTASGNVGTAGWPLGSVREGSRDRVSGTAPWPGPDMGQPSWGIRHPRRNKNQCMYLSR